MSNAQPVHQIPARGRYLNAVLTLIAALLAMNLLRGADVLPALSSASAERANPNSDVGLGMPNSAEQRAKMVRALDEMVAHLQALESRLNKGGFEVKVTEMPDVKIKE